MRKLIYCLLIFMVSVQLTTASTPSNALSGESRTVIKGQMRDAGSGEDLIGATVYVKELGTGAVSNVYGFYSLNIPPGEYTLIFSFIGYQPQTRSISLRESIILDIEFEPSSRQLAEVVVTGERPDQNVIDVRMSSNNLRMETIKSLPSFMGEVDIMKSLMLLPGVNSGGEGSTGLFVRGGNVDQNLILLDEATVYNASHLMGFFSVFNPDAIKDVQIYKGGMPAHYGGRLSSVVDIRMKEGNSRKFAATGGYGNISSRLTVEGPLQKNVSSFIVAGRRTYADLFLPFSADSTLRKSRLYFYDLNAKANYRFNDKNRLFFSGYFGRDVLKISDEFSMGWGNSTATARWNHIFNSRIFSNFTLIYSNFDYGLGANYGVNSWEWDSQIENYSLKSDFTWYLTPQSTVRFGMQNHYHRFHPGAIRGKGEQSGINDFGLPRNHALEHALYVSNEQTLGNLLTLEYGIRYSLFQNMGEATVYMIDGQYAVTDTVQYGKGEIYHYDHGLEPRLAMVYRIGDSQSAKASYNRTRQYLQQTQTTTTGTPTDIWFPASPNVKAQQADQWAAGYFRNFKNNTFETSLEAYYKTMGNQLDFKDRADILLNPLMEADLRSGKAWSYGLELMLSKTRGDFTGWFSYTLSRAWQQIEGINDGDKYPAAFDRPHDLSIVLAYDISSRINVSANWVYHTGRPTTLPVGRYEYGGVIVPLYAGRNESRMPDYHRLDLSMTLYNKQKPGRNWQSNWNLSLYNAYMRKNAFQYQFRQNEQNPHQTDAYMIYLFSIVPALTYNFSF